MYKKLLKATLTIINLSLAFLVFLFFLTKSNNEHTLKQIDISNNYQAIGIPIYPTNHKDYAKIIDALDETSKKLSVPYLKKSYYEGTVAGHPNYFSTVTHLTYEVSNLPSSLIKDNFETKFKNKIYSTKLSSPQKIKKYNLDITVRPITKFPETYEGSFYIESLESDVYKDFTQELRKNLNSKFHKNWSIKDFKPYPDIPLTYNATELNFNQLIITLSIFDLAFLVIYILSFSYEIGISRLHGYSIFYVIKKFILPEILLGLGIMLAISIPLSIYYNLNNYIYLLSAICLLIFFVQTLISSVITSILFLLPINNLLKHLSYNKGLFRTLFLAKGLLIIYLFFSAFSLFQLAKVSFPHHDKDYFSKYAAVFPLYQGYNTINDKDKPLSSHIKLVKQFIKDGSIYVDWASGPEGHNAVVNSTYLQFNPLKDTKNKQINISFNHKHLVFLLPEKNKNLKKEILNHLDSGMYGYDPHPEFIFIKNNQPIIRADTTKSSNYRYIAVFTLKTTDYIIPANWGTGNADDSLKIPLNGRTPQQIYWHYYPLLKKYNQDDNYPQVIYSKDANFQEIISTTGSIISDFIATFISIILFILVNIAVIYLYFSIYGQKIAIKQTLGYNYWNYLRDYWLLWLAQLAIIFILIKMIFPFTGPILLIGIGFLAILDFTISFIASHVFSRTILERYLYE